ncbi:MAG TPA: transcriptional regulator, partial [Lachnospiraceae bacterium]|nr:transcriptional regulator [Lachnospiraceae bacterium]
MWHGAAWNFVIWGIYFFVLLLIEKCFLLKILQKIPKFLRHIYALFFITAGWIIFACEDFRVLGSYIKTMAGINAPLFNNYSIYKLYTNLILLLLMAAVSVKLPHSTLLKLRSLFLKQHPDKNKLYFEITGFWAGAVFSFIILTLSISLLVSGTYNPFLYFR